MELTFIFTEGWCSRIWENMFNVFPHFAATLRPHFFQTGYPSSRTTPRSFFRYPKYSHTVDFKFFLIGDRDWNSQPLSRKFSPLYRYGWSLSSQVERSCIYTTEWVRSGLIFFSKPRINECARYDNRTCQLGMQRLTGFTINRALKRHG